MLAIVEMSCWRAFTPQQDGAKKLLLAFEDALEHIGSISGRIAAQLRGGSRKDRVLSRWTQRCCSRRPQALRRFAWSWLWARGAVETFEWLRLRGRPVEAVTRTHRPRRATHCLNAWEHRNRGMVARAAETETRVVEGAQNTNSETPG